VVDFQLCERPQAHAPPQPQPPPPALKLASPLLLPAPVAAKNTDSTRAVRVLSQFEHLIFASAWLIGRSASNLVLQ